MSIYVPLIYQARRACLTVPAALKWMYKQHTLLRHLLESIGYPSNTGYATRLNVQYENAKAGIQYECVNPSLKPASKRKEVFWE